MEIPMSRTPPSSTLNNKSFHFIGIPQPISQLNLHKKRTFSEAVLSDSATGPQGKKTHYLPSFGEFIGGLPFIR